MHTLEEEFIYFTPRTSGIAQRSNVLANESPSNSEAPPNPYPAPPSSKQQKINQEEKGLYQVRVLIQSIRVPILIKVQQHTLDGLFLNTVTKCVKTVVKRFTLS